MSLILETAFSSVSDLRLWFNTQSGAQLKLADIPDIIPLRWEYFKENWEFVKPTLQSAIDTYAFPSQLEDQIESMSKIIEIQRNAKVDTNPFSDSEVFRKHYAIFDNILVSGIPVSRTEQGIIDTKKKEVSRFIRSNFEEIRSNIVAGRELISDTVGGSDDDYNRVKDKSSSAKLRDIKVSDIIDMRGLMDAVKACDFIIANSFALDTVKLDPFALARENSNNPDIEIQSGKSGKLVTMFYGDTLQDLARRFLGNPDRWIEIAIANGLKAPYIDEVGEFIPLLSNGSVSQVNLAAENALGEANIEKINVGKAIFFTSNTELVPEQRNIINIKEVPVSGELILELDGDPDLEKYRIDENAGIRAYLPNTVNSQFLVTIPQQTPLPNEFGKKTPFFLKTKAEDEKKAGVDLSLSNDNDLAFTSTGDLQLSFGINNAAQAMKIKLETERGSLERHPEFGLPAVQGQKLTNPDAIKEDIIKSIVDMVEADSRFDRVDSINVERVVENGANGIRFGITVRLAGSGTSIPIGFTVNVN